LLFLCSPHPYAAALADEALVSAAERLFLQQISTNIAVDGQVMDFTQRDALHYVVYDLEPLTMAVIAARPFGRHWLALQGTADLTVEPRIQSPRKRKIRYVAGQDQRPYYMRQIGLDFGT